MGTDALIAEVRLATAADAAGLARLRYRWEGEHAGPAGEPPAEVLDGLGTAMAAWMRAHAESHVCAVAVRGDAVVGMAWLAVTGRPPIPADADRRSGDVQSVFVLPELRSHGLGGRLLGALHEVAAARGITRITVHASSEALAFYARLGYEPDPRLLAREA